MGAKSMSGRISIDCCWTEHWEFVRNLRNHPEVKKGFINQQNIDWLTHKRYMSAHSKDYWVLLKDGNPIGFVGSVDGDIRIAIVPEESGNGYGKILINHVMEQRPLSQAKVKLKNEASIRMFEGCGFEKKYYILEKENETKSV
jgi:ribosomal protein S18 acetylase RimI-like enzyme